MINDIHETLSEIRKTWTRVIDEKYDSDEYNAAQKEHCALCLSILHHIESTDKALVDCFAALRLQCEHRAEDGMCHNQGMTDDVPCARTWAWCPMNKEAVK